MPSLDLAWVRAQFPALAETVHDQPAIFFDSLIPPHRHGSSRQ